MLARRIRFVSSALGAASTLTLAWAALAQSVGGGASPAASSSGPENRVIHVNGHEPFDLILGNFPSVIDIFGTSGNANLDVMTIRAAQFYSAITKVGDGTSAHAVTVVGGVSKAFSASSEMRVTAHSILDLGGFVQTVSSLRIRHDHEQRRANRHTDEHRRIDIWRHNRGRDARHADGFAGRCTEPHTNAVGTE